MKTATYLKRPILLAGLGMLTGYLLSSLSAHAYYVVDAGWMFKDANSSTNRITMTEKKQLWSDEMKTCGIKAIRIDDVKRDGVRIFDIRVKTAGPQGKEIIVANWADGRIFKPTKDDNNVNRPSDETSALPIPGADEDGFCIQSVSMFGNAVRDQGPNQPNNDKPAIVFYDLKKVKGKRWVDEYYPMGKAVSITGGNKDRNAMQVITLDGAEDADKGISSLRFDADRGDVELLELTIKYCLPNMPTQVISLFGKDSRIPSVEKLVDVKPGPGNKFVELDDQTPNRKVELPGERRCVKSVTATVRASQDAVEKGIIPNIQAFAVKGKPTN